VVRQALHASQSLDTQYDLARLIMSPGREVFDISARHHPDDLIGARLRNLAVSNKFPIPKDGEAFVDQRQLIGQEGKNSASQEVRSQEFEKSSSGNDRPANNSKPARPDFFTKSRFRVGFAVKFFCNPMFQLTRLARITLRDQIQLDS
jgi:hypothetical protein